jgi:dephospho-CoA kinase
VPILDADLFARQAVAVGSGILEAISQRYGEELLNPDGTLKRRHLGDIIFSNPVEKQWVEQQIHPFVRRCFDNEMAKMPEAPTVVHAIPLLFEAGLEAMVTEIWVVTCSQDVQLTRLMRRDSLSKEDAWIRIKNQWSLEEKAQRADIVIDNSSTIEALQRQIDYGLGID